MSNAKGTKDPWILQFFRLFPIAHVAEFELKTKQQKQSKNWKPNAGPPEFRDNKSTVHIFVKTFESCPRGAQICKLKVGSDLLQVQD
jgi:hypothetical protein